MLWLLSLQSSTSIQRPDLSGFTVHALKHKTIQVPVIFLNSLHIGLKFMRKFPPKCPSFTHTHSTTHHWPSLFLPAQGDNSTPSSHCSESPAWLWQWEASYCPLTSPVSFTDSSLCPAHECVQFLKFHLWPSLLPTLHAFSPPLASTHTQLFAQTTPIHDSWQDLSPDLRFCNYSCFLPCGHLSLSTGLWGPQRWEPHLTQLYASCISYIFKYNI